MSDPLLLTLVLVGCALLTGALALPLYLGKIPPNRFYGFRTPRVIADERVWYPVNKVGGRDLLLASVVGAVGSAVAMGLGSVGAAIAVYLVPLLVAMAHGLWFASDFVGQLDAEDAAREVLSSKREEPAAETVAPRPRPQTNTDG